MAGLLYGRVIYLIGETAETPSWRRGGAKIFGKHLTHQDMAIIGRLTRVDSGGNCTGFWLIFIAGCPQRDEADGICFLD